MSTYFVPDGSLSLDALLSINNNGVYVDSDDDGFIMLKDAKGNCLSVYPPRQSWSVMFERCGSNDPTIIIAAIESKFNVRLVAEYDDDFEEIRMNVGQQYKPDDEFKAKARLFQSQYRADVLGVEYRDYGNRLTDSDAKDLLNYYDKLNSRESLRKRYPSYARRRDADMLRSEHIPFNLLAPLDTNHTEAIQIISKAWGIECDSIELIEVEYAPSPKDNYLCDGTAFDTYFKVILKNGNTCGIGVEVKYTEQDYQIGETERINVENHQSLYWRTASVSGCFRNPDDEVFGTDPLRQIWRNHLLGLKMIEVGDVDEFYSITLFPNGNKHFHSVMPKYTSLLTDENLSYVIGCTFEDYISGIGGTPELEEWKKWLKRRYLV